MDILATYRRLAPMPQKFKPDFADIVKVETNPRDYGTLKFKPSVKLSIADGTDRYG